MYPLTVFAWDSARAEQNLRRHGVDFAEATAALLDVRARLPGNRGRYGGYFLLARHDDAFILCHCRDEEPPVTRLLSAMFVSHEEAARLPDAFLSRRSFEEQSCAPSTSKVLAIPNH